MARITLGGAIPPEEMNGLGTDAVVKAFTDHPTTAVLVVAVVSRSKLVISDDKRTQYPVLRIRHWEVVGEEDRAAVAGALARALAARTGLAELPFEPGGEVIVDAGGGDEDEPEGLAG